MALFPLIRFCTVLAALCAWPPPARAQVLPVFAANGASFAPGLSPGIASLFSPNSSFSFSIGVGDSLPLPTGLAGVEVRLNTDLASLLYVSPAQINLIVPDKFAGERVHVQVYRAGRLTHHTSYQCSPTLGLFSANSRGNGLAAAVVFNPTTSLYVPVVSAEGQPQPIEVGAAASPNYLILYSTGGSLAGRNVRVVIDNVWLVPSFAGAAPGLIGLQQVNVALGTVFADRGLSTVRVVVDGVGSNEVLVFFR